LRQNRALAAALGAITAAVVGVIMNLALWFALHVVFDKVASVGWGVEVPVPSSLDWRAALLSVAAMVAMFRLKLGMLPTLAASALAGLFLSAL
ncbi:MAG: chromate transporter, partial [Mesorhizobium sp.]